MFPDKLTSGLGGALAVLGEPGFHHCQLGCGQEIICRFKTGLR